MKFICVCKDLALYYFFFTFILCHIVVLMQKEAIKTQKTSMGFLNKGIINFKVKNPLHVSV